MMSLAQHGLRVLGGLAILLGWTTPPAVAARDPAPIVDEVVQALVHRPLARQATSLPAVLHRHLDETVSLLADLEEALARPATPSGPGASLMLLESKLHELGVLRTELRDQ